MKRLFVAAAALALYACAPAAYAQLVDYEPGNEPPPGTFGPIQTHQRPADPGPPLVPIIDVQMDPQGNAPYFQHAHNGRYTYADGAGARLIYQHLSSGDAVISVLLPDGRWAEAMGTLAGRSQALLDLYVDDEAVGELKIGTVATTGSPPPKSGAQAKAGVPCGRLIARARFGIKLAFPFDPNLSCSVGPGNPGTYCRVQVLDEKIGVAGSGPETCNLQR